MRLYQQIAESLRQEILHGILQPGERLPPVRETARRWKCTPGTAQRAYQELARQGLLVSRPGQGTRVAGSLQHPSGSRLRQATLLHRAEAFLLDMLSNGYNLEETEHALQGAMELWRASESQPIIPPASTLRFAGSHDLSLAWISSRFGDLSPGWNLQLRFTGSLAGLLALAEGNADLAGCHLFDGETVSYNLPFVRRVLPDRRAALVRLANRRLGFILAPGNPLGIHTLSDLVNPELRFCNRQSGSGTRVWLDVNLRQRGIDPGAIPGYSSQLTTHSAVAQAVSDGQVDCGVGLEAAARSLALDFIPLAFEPYDLVMFSETIDRPPMSTLLDWLKQPETQAHLAALPGYETSETGHICYT